MSVPLPFVVLLFLAWWFSSPTSLGEVARREALRRAATPPAARALTDADADRLTPSRSSIPESNRRRASEPPAGRGSAGAPDAEAAPASKAHDETWWRDRRAKAQGTVDRDQLLADALQTRINALAADEAARDDPVARGQLNRERLQALAELSRMRAQLAVDQAALAALRDEARREGIPPGWVR